MFRSIIVYTIVFSLGFFSSCQYGKVKSAFYSDLEAITLTHNNFMLIEGAIDRDSVDRYIDEIVNLDKMRGKAKYTIYIVINSPGGSVMDGERLISVIDMFDNIKTISIFSASMAHAIAQATKGERLGIKNNIMLAHQMSIGVSGRYNAEKLEELTKQLLEFSEFFDQRNADRIGISLKEYRSRIKKDWITMGKASVYFNNLDRIIELKCSREVLDDVKEQTVEKTFLVFKYKQKVLKSKCPLIPDKAVQDNVETIEDEQGDI